MTDYSLNLKTASHARIRDNRRQYKQTSPSHCFSVSRMAPSYKFTYFNGRGAGEFIRYIFAYAGIDYEDKRIEIDDWSKLKEQTPFGQLPLLEVNGKKINQSIAIGRYLAKQAKIAGNNDWEDLEIDAVVDTINDLRLKVLPIIVEKDEAKKTSLKATVEKETIPFYLARLETLVTKNNGYLALGRLTWADFYFAASIAGIQGWVGATNLLDQYKALANLKKKVEGLPAITKWIQTRPETQF